jgi:broad specificity phosphatase PhoE
VYRQAQKRQQHIARVCGQESRIGQNGLRLVAQIDETVFNYWEQREGPEFWKHELKYMLKRHPELAVKAKSETLKLGYTGQPRVRGRGRWAAA